MAPRSWAAAPIGSRADAAEASHDSKPRCRGRFDWFVRGNGYSAAVPNPRYDCAPKHGAIPRNDAENDAHRLSDGHLLANSETADRISVLPYREETVCPLLHESHVRKLGLFDSHARSLTRRLADSLPPPRKLRWTVVLAAACMLGLLAPASARSQESGNLTGRWVLNRNQSQVDKEVGFNPVWLAASPRSADRGSRGGEGGGRGGEDQAVVTRAARSAA